MRWKFKLAVLSSFAISGVAMAQTPPADQSQTTPNPAAATADHPAAAPTEAAPRKKAEEEIIVTGSRVRRKDLTTPAPVTVISKEQIQASGIASIGDFLQQMPEQAGATNSNVNNAGDGQTHVSLRNLGAQRTLVLADGKRWVNGGSGAGAPRGWVGPGAAQTTAPARGTSPARHRTQSTRGAARASPKVAPRSTSRRSRPLPAACRRSRPRARATRPPPRRRRPT